MSECDRRNGMSLLSRVRVICPPTFFGTARLRFEITQELQPQTTVESADVYTRRTSADASAAMRVWKLSQDVYTAAFDECLLVCQRAAGLTSSPACSLPTSPAFPFTVGAAGSDVEPGKEFQRRSSDACWRCLTSVSFKYLPYIQATVVQQTEATRILVILQTLMFFWWQKIRPPLPSG